MTTTRTTNEGENRLKEIRMNPDGTEVLMVAAVSDVGCVRKNNEDSYGLFPSENASGSSLFVIADGMGGAAAGEVASRLAVDTVRDSFGAPQDGVEIPAKLEHSIQEANGAIFRKAATDPELGGMGTTCTATAIQGRKMYVAHVGDSRAYLVTAGDIKQLTRDHSLAAELERRGDARAGSAGGAKHVLTRCLGVGDHVAVEVAPSPVELNDGASLVLCSDGLSNLVDPGEILHLVSMHLPEKACRRLVDLARERGAPDNVTVVVARMRVA
jgi:protein phosphatase